MAEAVYKSPGNAVGVTAGSARTGGEVAQTPDGRACFYPTGVAAADRGEPLTEGVVLVTKPTSFVYLAGMEIYWDHSANATCLWPVNDKDFFLGTVQKDTASTDLTCLVKLNSRANCVFRADRDPARSVLTRTAGLANLLHSGGSHSMKFSLDAEAQAGDVISVRSVPIASKWIFQAVGCVVVDADADVVDVVFGMADATHASDPDAITTSAFFHLDLTGSNANIYAESDNAAAEVAAQDTTIDWTAGTPFHLMIDGRSGDGSGLIYYVNGVRVVSGSAFTVAGAAGPLKALFLCEKSSNDSPGTVALDDMRIWLSDDAAA